MLREGFFAEKDLRLVKTADDLRRPEPPLSFGERVRYVDGGEEMLVVDIVDSSYVVVAGLDGAGAYEVKLNTLLLLRV